MRQSKWYIQIDGKRQGPYSYEELRHHPHVTPFTLAHKKRAVNAKVRGARSKQRWRMMGQIAELKSLFQATPVSKQTKERKKEHFTDVLVKAGGSNLPTLLLWCVLLFLAIIFVMFTYSGRL